MSSAITAAVVGVAGSAYISNKNNKAADKRDKAAQTAGGLENQIAIEQWDKYVEMYEPLERQMVDEAQDYASRENYAKAAGEASATVSQQFSKARDRLTRTPGLDPSSAAYQSSLVGLDMAQAASDATQQNLARKNVADMAYARKTDALSLGKGLPAQAASGFASVNAQNTSAANQQSLLASQKASAFGTGVSNIFNAAQKLNWLGGSQSPGLDALQTGPSANTNFNYYSDTPSDLSGTSFI